MKFFKKLQTNSNGFTLVELLIVIAIIIILNYNYYYYYQEKFSMTVKQGANEITGNKYNYNNLK